MIYRIAACEIDTDTYEVRRHGERVPVEPQVFDLILLLVENVDRIITRDEIIDRVWKGRIVSEAAISSRLKAARRVLGDDGKSQSMIRTIHRRGIRFVGTLSVPGDETQATGIEAPPRETFAPESTRPATAVSAAPGGDPAHADGAAGVDLSLPKRPSLIVLPFHVLSGEEEHRIISDGLALDIMTGLARTRWLFVISRGTALMFRGPSQDPMLIARKVGVRYVLQGAMQFNGSRLRIQAALTDAVGGREIWAEHYDRPLDDIFAVQDEISSIIVGAVESEIEQSERHRALLTPPSSLDAWSAYHRASWHMFQFTPSAYEEAERLFGLAAKLDPGSARVFAGLSFVHWQRAFLEIGKDRQLEIDRATELARHALLLDPRDPQGHWALGRAFQLVGDFDQAIEEMEQAVALNPNFAIGHYSVAFARALASDNTRSDEAVIRARRLSPYDLMNFAMLATQAMNASLLGRLDDGAELADRAARQANAHYHILGIAAFCNALAGRSAAAAAYVARLAKAHPGYRIGDYLRAFAYRDPHVRGLVRSTLGRLGLSD
ncbi:MAG: winged helix-turn-helix domain-containing protein [Hyphomicrobiaceae bacterium]|nr:winged helix-turn-helix domain-containing protein [Hyphomicrobiaceae bacterium]